MSDFGDVIFELSVDCACTPNANAQRAIAHVNSRNVIVIVRLLGRIKRVDHRAATAGVVDLVSPIHCPVVGKPDWGGPAHPEIGIALISL